MYQVTPSPTGNKGPQVGQRIHLWYGALALAMLLFGVRLFYLQVIKHDYYKEAALKSQLKQYELPAERGIILAHEGNQMVPLVLNEKRYTLFADPLFIKDAGTVAQAVQKIIGGDAKSYKTSMQGNTQYAVLAQKITQSQKDKIDKLNINGLGTTAITQRTYPQGDVASQLLGFVNDSGVGEYGVEQALNKQLAGTPGQLRAITDANGVPLVANSQNVLTAPKNGDKVGLTIDISMQQQLEDILKAGLKKANSQSGSALIMNPNTGAVDAIANYPTYNPAEYYNVQDPNVFNDAAVSSPLEVGSSMKPLTVAAALNQGVVTKNTTFYDPAHWVVDGFNITDIEQDGGPGVRSIGDILQLSLNTGATWLLMQMGGGQINKKARDTWYDYMVNHYQFGKPTGIEQGYESPGSIPNPDSGYALDLQYANTAFGQGMTATPLQMGGALSSVINGGNYYQLHLVDYLTNSEGKTTTTKPVIIQKNVVKPAVSKTLQSLMEYTFNTNHVLYGMPDLPSAYNIGGKTGTAQIAQPGGGYYSNKFNGTFVGFVGGDQPQYVIVIRVNEPQVDGYAGAAAAAPVFSNVASMLIDNFNVTPKSQ